MRSDPNRQVERVVPDVEQSDETLPSPERAFLPYLLEHSFSTRPLVEGFTIDPFGSRDHDDAIWIRRCGSDQIIDVSIADVGELVHKGTPLDIEAREKAFTRYYGSHNDPMLPHALSEHELSIVHGESRPTVTVSIPINSSWHIGRPEIQLTQIKSSHTITYSEADRAIKSNRHELSKSLQDLRKIAEVLLEIRSNRGSIVLSDLQRGILSDENGSLRVVSPDRVHSHLIIQELMILTNEIIANRLIEAGIPALFRNHTIRSGATKEAIEAYLAKAAALGGQALEDHQQGLGRYFNRALYGVKNVGHFALSLPAYMHFTSPIRRYPDLINARQLKALLANQEPPYTVEELKLIEDDINSTNNAHKDAQRIQVNSTPKVTSEKQPEAGLSLRTDKDIAELLFKPESESVRGSSEGNEILSILKSSLERVPSIITIGKTMNSIESEVRTISISGPDHAKTFEVVAGIALKDQGLIYGKHRVAHQKQHAERLALLSALHALVGLPEPEETPLTSGVQLEKAQLAEAPPNKNPISQLSELVQKESRLSNLAFDVLRIGGTDHAPIFQATVSVVVDRRNSKNFAATDSNSKKAKESAARGLITILHDDFRPATPHAIDLSESPLEEDSPQWKSLLNELCQKNKISPPKFTHEKHGKDHAPIFKCKGLLITKDVTVESDFTNGATRKEAEYRACYQLYQRLAKEIAR